MFSSIINSNSRSLAMILSFFAIDLAKIMLILLSCYAKHQLALRPSTIKV